MKKFSIPPEQLEKNIERVRDMIARDKRIDGMPAHMSWEECRSQNVSLKKQLEALQMLLEDEQMQHHMEKENLVHMNAALAEKIAEQDAEIRKLKDVASCLVDFISMTNPTIAKALGK